MLITKNCKIKNKLSLLIELIRVHEHFATKLEAGYDSEEEAEDALESIECLGLELEVKKKDNMWLSDIIIAELLSINDGLFKEIYDDNDFSIHYYVSYYNPTIWEIERF